MIKREQKRLRYKQAGNIPDKSSLQSLVDQAIKRFDYPHKRVEKLGADGEDVRFISLIRKHNGVTLGLMHSVSRGAAQHVIDMMGKEKHWEVVPVSAQTDTAPGREFIQGTLFFGLWGNHVVVNQSLSCTETHFQDHATWLLGEASDGSGSTVLVELEDPLPKALRRKKHVPVKEIEFTSVLRSKALETSEKVQTKSIQFEPSGDLWDGILKFFASRNVDLPSNLGMSNALDEQDVKAKLTLSTTKKRSESSAGEVLTQLGTALRGADGDFYRLKLADGTMIKQSQTRIEKMTMVDCSNRLPVAESMFRAIASYFEELIEAQTITDGEDLGNA